MSNDIDRCGKGIFTPGLRDDAQDARSELLTKLTKFPDKKAYLALVKLATEHPFDDAKVWMENKAQKHLEKGADLPNWSIEDVVKLAKTHECRPVSPRDLFNTAQIKLTELKAWLEHGDDSAASSWAREDQETKHRILIANWLRDRTNNNFSIHQEEEQADAKKPDIRLHSERFDAPVPVELKIADNWSGKQLFERLENQLCNDYLRDSRINFRVFLLVNRGTKSNWLINDQKHNFNVLIECLQMRAKELNEQNVNVEAVAVMGIDLALREKPMR